MNLISYRNYLVFPDFDFTIVGIFPRFYYIKKRNP
jgi:hypothetical protein